MLLCATCPAPEFRDPERAGQRARQPTELGRENGRWWHLLGVAQYQTCKYREAVASLNQSIQLRSGGDSFDRLFLAMAHWQLGDKEKARERYDQAVDYIENRGRRLSRDFTPLDLLRFRSEAEELLGVDQQVPAAAKGEI